MCVLVCLQYKEGKRVVECLKKAARIAKQCMEPTVQVQLYIDLINTFALFNEKGNEEVRLRPTGLRHALLSGERRDRVASSEPECVRACWYVVVCDVC